MTNDPNDLTLARLRTLRVVEPDAARSARVRTQCRAAVAWQAARHRDARSTRFAVVDRGLTYALSISYFAAMLYDLGRLYLRR